MVTDSANHICCNYPLVTLELVHKIQMLTKFVVHRHLGVVSGRKSVIFLASVFLLVQVQILALLILCFDVTHWRTLPIKELVLRENCCWPWVIDIVLEANFSVKLFSFVDFPLSQVVNPSVFCTCEGSRKFIILVLHIYGWWAGLDFNILLQKFIIV